MSGNKDFRTYQRADCAVFRKTADAFGGLSNMAPGFPVRINGTRILTVEALYQACRFPHRPEIQRKIIEQTSPMTAKMVGKPFRDDSRPDWDRVRVKIMRWVLRLKLAMHWTQFSALLLSTGNQPIVEDSRKDDFWGTLPNENGMLVGRNVLGRLLMELREEIKQGAELRRVEPPEIANFLLFGEQIQVVNFRTDGNAPLVEEEIAAKNSTDALILLLFAEAGVVVPPRADVMTTAIPVERRPAMIEGLKPYAEYKDSGQEWLGNVPAHWRVPRLKTVLREKDARSLDGSGLLLSLTRNRGLIARSDMTDKVHSARTLAGYKIYEPGEIVMNRMQAWSGMFGAGNKPGLVSPDYAVFKVIGEEVAALLLARIKAPDLVSQFALESKGIGSGFNRLYSDRFGAIAVSLPPPDEQAAIVRFLDHANRKIDSFIRAKRKLIGLLNEQKQAIIHHAVTRGLDPDVPLKPSGIPWLGDIPKHWEPRQLKRATTFVTSGSRGWANFYSDDGLVFIQSGNLGRNMALNFSYTQHVRPPLGAEGERTRVHRDDILICITGALTGNVVHVNQDLPGPSFVNQHVALVRVRKVTVRPRFLAFALRSEIGQGQFKTSEYGGTKQGLGLGDVKDVYFPLPSLTEQDVIIEHIDSSLAVFNTAITRTEREIALMQEYRTRLTADIVTGKLDVREAAAKLPDLPTDPAAEPTADVFDEAEDLEETSV